MPRTGENIPAHSYACRTLRSVSQSLVPLRGGAEDSFADSDISDSRLLVGIAHRTSLSGSDSLALRVPPESAGNRCDGAASLLAE